MALTKRTVTGQITVDEFGNTGVRTDTIYEDDGVEVSRTFRREVLAPGDSTSGKDAKVVAVATALWTPQLISDAQAKKAAVGKGKP